ncbi:11256_t:CDS:1, partial [Funneliformis geosporum]
RDEIQEQLIKAENQLSELKLANQQLTSDKQALTEQITKLTSQFAVLTAELATNKERNEETREQIDKLNNDLTTERENTQNLIKQIQRLTEQRDIFQHRYQGQKDQLTITEQELATITKNHANCPTPTEIEQAQHDFDLLISEKNNLATELTTATNDLTNEKSLKQKHLKNYRIT